HAADDARLGAALQRERRGAFGPVAAGRLCKAARGGADAAARRILAKGARRCRPGRKNAGLTTVTQAGKKRSHADVVLLPQCLLDGTASRARGRRREV